MRRALRGARRGGDTPWQRAWTPTLGALVAALWLGSAPGHLHAQQAPPSAHKVHAQGSPHGPDGPGSRPRTRRARRHEGTQLRVALGAGGLYAHQSLEGGADEMSGAGMQLDISLGEMISREFALQIDLALFHAPDAPRGVLGSTAVTALHLGIGSTYWWMPHNVYASGSVGFASSSVEASPVYFAGEEIPDVEVSGVGLGLHLAAGKQWWISRRAGLGLSASVLAMEMPNGLGEGAGPRLLVSAVLGLAVTYR